MKYDDDREQIDPYLNWAFVLQDLDPSRVFDGDPWEAVLVQPLTEKIFEEIREDPNLRVDVAEQKLAKFAQEKTGRLAPFFLYRKLGYAQLRPTFRVLVRGLPTDEIKVSDNVGKPVGFASLQEEAVPQAQSQIDDDILLAVIDDGLGFLNERFQREEPGGLETRIEGVFIQSIQQNVPPIGGMIFGRDLSKADIQALITDPDERKAYKDINDTVFAFDTIRTTEQAESHGSFIADLAGGADPADVTDPMRDVPMALVQLPPQIVDDTSGIQMVPHILQALHWILFKALVLGKSRVVVNLSFGITAGPKDSTSLFATHVAFLIQLADILGVELNVVVPFGNDYQNRQVAAMALPSKEKITLSMRLQSDDRAPSYVEIRPEGPAQLDQIAMGVVAPDGTETVAQPLAEGAFRDIIYRGKLVGRFYHVAGVQGRAPYLMIAFAPTAPVRDDMQPLNGQGPLIESGAWTILIGDESGQGADLRFEIQRGDTMPGYRHRGKQAYFDDPDGYEYDVDDAGPSGNPSRSKAYTRLGAGAYVTQDGTNSAFTVVDAVAGRFHTVGGAFLPKTDPSLPIVDQADAVSAQYTSLNTRKGRGDPTAGARSDHNRALPGLRAAGVLSGSGARFSGSSAAAAVYSRSLIESSFDTVDATAPGRLPEAVHRGQEPRD